MLRRILVRVAIGVATLLAVSAIVFLGTEALPGDAAQAVLGQTATPQLLHQYRHDWGLDRPVLTRYGDWLSGCVRGDLGKSLPSGDPVSKIISDKARNTFALAIATLIVLVPLSVGLGILSAVRRDSVLDQAVSSSTLTLIATPEFVVGTLLAVVVAVWLGWLPPVSLVDATRPITSQLDLLVLPVLALLAAAVAQTIRMVRATMIDVLQSDYVQMARLKGVAPWNVMLRHALPNALGPTIQILAFTVGWLIGGVVVVETVFQYPGLGLTFRNAVSARDLPTVEAIAMVVTGVYVVVNLLADIAVILLNPRLRRAGR
jgi:peptide/nickel transport system permease protein